LPRHAQVYSSPLTRCLRLARGLEAAIAECERAVANGEKSLGKTNPLSDDDLADFIAQQQRFAATKQSWSVDVADIDAATWDLSVKNPNGGGVVVMRTAQEVLDEIEFVHVEPHRCVQVADGKHERRTQHIGHPSSLLPPNAEADQRRTTDSASPLDSIRRLIQRMVLAALLCQSPPNPQGISASIYDRNDHQYAFAQRVVDAKGKSLGQRPMVSKGDFMNAAVIRKGIDIGDQAATEIVTKPRRLPLIEPIALGEVSLRIGGNADNHRPSCIKRAFASAQADTVARPSSSRRLRSSRTSRCHSGDCTSPGWAHRLSQTLSRRRTFSATDIVSIEISVDMRASSGDFSITDCQNVGDQRLATLDFPSGPLLSRVRCIGWFGALGRKCE
jgi:hypothetical protein